MKYWRQTALLIAACGLLTTLAWEISAFTPSPPTSVSRPPATIVAGPLDVAPDHSNEWVATILARPLFNRDRRPTPEASSAGRGPQSLPRLSGVMIDPSGRRAIFAVEGSKPLVVNEGERVEAWTVETIEAGSVHITGPGGDQTLHPSFARGSQPMPSVAKQSR